MSYIVLARKYRPQTFEEVVGQHSVSKTLLNAVETGRIAHAYIFSGPRGVGKTTTARLLAKCLNCEKGPTLKPCNQCESCQAIGAGSSMEDVLEIDGASNRGIEQIRELRENAKYTPSRSRYRIYIIDEAHQITKDAFGALLKTLEEPPAHAIFMMATTEVHKIPAPILSRCQRFSLRPIAPELVFGHLQEICKKEKIKVEDDALRYIVRFVEGSLRDALSLLDQAVVYSPDQITTTSLRDLLGLLPAAVIENFSAAFKVGDPAPLLKLIANSIKEGIDLTQLAKDLQAHYHSLLLIKAGVDDPLLATTKEKQAEANTTSFSLLERNIRLLARCMEEMRRSETPRAVFEVAALKLAQKIVDPRELVARLNQVSSGPISVAPIVRSTPPPAPTTKPLSKPSASLGEATQQKILSKWPELVQEVSQTKQVLSTALEEAELTFDNQDLLLRFSNSFNEKLVSQSEALLHPLMQTVFGTPVPFKTEVDPSLKNSKPLSSPSTSAVGSPVSMPQTTEMALEEIGLAEVDEDVKKAVKHFPGVLKRKAKDT